MNCLNVEVSYFKRNTDAANPVTVNLLTYLRSERHKSKVEQVRAAETKVERTYLKEHLPGITPHGVFSYRDAKHRVKPSGLIQGDVDFDKNPYEVESIKREISKIANVAYCGLSTSGNGVWFLIPIAYPEKHREHYAAMVEDFARLGFVLDTNVEGVQSFRYFSHDPNAYFNPQATIYKKLIELPAEAVKFIGEAKKVEFNESSPASWAAKYLIEIKANIAYQYSDLMAVSAACKYEWGEEGKGVALAILEHSTNFLSSNFRRDFDSHWQSFKRQDGYVSTGANLVKLAQKHRGQTTAPAPARDTAPQPTPSPLRQAADMLAGFDWEAGKVEPLDEKEAAQWKIKRDRALQIINN